MPALKKKQKELSVLHDFISHFADFPKGKIRKTESPDFVIELTPRRMLGIEITRLQPAGSPAHNHRYIPPDVNRETLEYTIARKEEKLPIYREKKLDLIWLIITIDGKEDASNQNLAGRMGNRDFQSTFHRIFLFETGSGQIHVLK